MKVPMDEPDRALTFSDTAAPHPEAMHGAVDVALGRHVRIRATARATPAGLLALAAAFAAVLVPAYLIVRATSGERRRR